MGGGIWRLETGVGEELAEAEIEGGKGEGAVVHYTPPCVTHRG